MGDDRYSYVHFKLKPSYYFDDTSDFDFELPHNEDIDIPSGLLPNYENDNDDSLWPINTHPSYPYGNPYAPTPSSILPGVPQKPRWVEYALEALLPISSVPEEALPNNGVAHEGASGNDDQVSASPEDEAEEGEEGSEAYEEDLDEEIEAE